MLKILAFGKRRRRIFWQFFLRSFLGVALQVQLFVFWRWQGETHGQNQSESPVYSDNLQSKSIAELFFLGDQSSNKAIVKYGYHCLFLFFERGYSIYLFKSFYCDQSLKPAHVFYEGIFGPKISPSEKLQRIKYHPELIISWQALLYKTIAQCKYSTTACADSFESGRWVS